jgi:hypothetical protein
LPLERGIEFRVGIHLGDIVEEGDFGNFPHSKQEYMMPHEPTSIWFGVKEGRTPCTLSFRLIPPWSD